MKPTKTIICLILILFFCSPASMANTFTDYQSNLIIDIPEGWTAKVYDDDPSRFLAVANINYKFNPILIIPTPIPEFQNHAMFYNIRTLLNWPDTELANILEEYVNKVKSNDTNIKILSSKIISNHNNKSIFIMYENNSYRYLSAFTIINGIRYETILRVDLPDNNKKTEMFTPIFLSIVNSIQSAY